MSRREERHARGVIHRLGVHRVDDTDLVRDLPCVGHEVRHPGAAVFVLLEVLEWSKNGILFVVSRHRAETNSGTNRLRNVLSVPRIHARLVVKEVEVRRATGLHQVDDPFRFRGVRRKSRGAGAVVGEGLSGAAFFPDEGSKRRSSNPGRRFAEELTARLIESFR